VEVGVKPYSTENGVDKGYFDAKITNLFSLMFHGLIDLKTPNDFTKGDIRATDAAFKFGFMSDPLIAKIPQEGKSTFAGTVTSNKFYGIDAVCGLPIIGAYLKPKSTESSEETTESSEETTISPL